MAKIRKKYSSQAKVKIVLEGLAYPDGIQSYCRKMGIRDVMFYKWKKQIYERADSVFENQKKPDSVKQRLKETIDKKDKIISALVEENITLKKNIGPLV